MDTRGETRRDGSDEGRYGDAAAVALRGVGFRRSGRTILSDVDLTVGRGEKWVLFGPNGIGKSTLVRMMATRAHPTCGTVDILGRRLGKVDVFSYRHLIGLSSAELLRALPDLEDPLDAVVTALRAVTGRWRDIYTPDEIARARSLMRDFGIEYLVGGSMAKLSEGERTRVMVCRSLMARSELLILDEPTTGLDLGGREITLRALGAIGRDDPRAVVLVTHRLEEIPTGFDHVAVMGRMGGTDGDGPAPGTIVYAGPIAEGLTDERLSAVFGLDLAVRRDGGRWSARLRG